MLVLALWLGGWLLAADTSRFTSELAVAYTADVMSPLAGASVRPVWMDNVDVTLTLHLTPRTTLFFYGLGNQGGSISARWRRTGRQQHRSTHLLAPLRSVCRARDGHRPPFRAGGAVRPEQRVRRATGRRAFHQQLVRHRRRAGRQSSAGAVDLSRDLAGTPGSPGLSAKRPVCRLPAGRGARRGPGRPDRPAGTHIVFGRNDGLLLVAEAGALVHPEAPLPDGSPIQLVSRLHEHPHHHKLALGLWYYTARFRWLDADRTQRGNAGVYLLAESRLYREDPRTLWAFLRVGLAHPRVNRFGAYTGGGLSGRGWVPGRPADRMGLAVAAAHNSSAYRHLQRQQGTPVHRTEWVFEGTYLLALSTALRLQFDLQWVLHPDTRAGSVLVGGLRLLWSP